MLSLEEVKDKIFLCDTTPGKGVHLSLCTDNLDRIEEFKGLCYQNLSKGLHWFHQCNSKSYQMFEFWRPQTETMTLIAKAIAEAMGVELVIDLDRDYPSAHVVEMERFRPFDKDLHTFDNFFS